MITQNTTLGELVTSCAEIFEYGSRVYGTYSVDSDYDNIAVLNEGVLKNTSILNYGEYHYQVYTYEEFLYKIKNHDIMALECILIHGLGRKHNKVDFTKYFELDLGKLRSSISTISSHSYVKGEKKLIVSGDYDKHAGMKSVFHSMRILSYGTQIARYYSIPHVDECNWIWDEIKALGEKYDADVLWEHINAKFKSVFNSMATEFRKVAPKNTKGRDKVRELNDLLKQHNCHSSELSMAIQEIFRAE